MQHTIHIKLYYWHKIRRPRWSHGYHTRHWIRGSWVQTRPGSMDFFQRVKILSMTSFGREVKPWFPVVDLRHAKEPQAEIRAPEQNLSDFSSSTEKATLMAWDVKERRKTQVQQRHQISMNTTEPFLSVKLVQTICTLPVISCLYRKMQWIRNVENNILHNFSHVHFCALIIVWCPLESQSLSII